MTSTRDVQDMLGLSGQAPPRPKPSKKGKNAGEKRQGEGLWNKEIRSLIGERAPPTHLIDATPQLKQKRHLVRSGPVRSWQLKRFENDARTDGLVLRHWRRTDVVTRPFDRAGTGKGAVDGEGQEEGKPEEVDEGPYRFAKFNHQVTAQDFDHETYETHLKKDGWTEAETRYLMELYVDFYGKWPLIWDRYEWQPEETKKTAPNADAMQIDDQQPNGTTTTTAAQTQAQEQAPQPPPAAPQPQPQPRTMEDLKSRFYNSTATLLALSTPPHKMTPTQYSAHETLTRYNPAHETSRKRIKDSQMSRSTAEKREEDFLIAELRRIYFTQERADAELREVRARLDHSLSDDRNPGQTYAGSREIQELFNRVIKADPSGKNKARRSLEGPPGSSMAAPSPTASSTTAGAGAAAQKKGSMSTTTPGTGADATAATVRQLSPRAALRHGLSTHERLTPGISFRSDRIAKMRAPSKANAQNVKIAAMLAELGVPEVLVMPTVSVTRGMEELCRGVEELVRRRLEREKIVADARVGVEVGRLGGGGGDGGDGGGGGDGGDGGGGGDGGEGEKEKEANVKTEETGESMAPNEPIEPTEAADAADPDAGDEEEQEEASEDEAAAEDEDEANAAVEAEPAEAPTEAAEPTSASQKVVPAAAPAPTSTATSTATSTRARNKRSASVLSASSAGSRAGTKRVKSGRN